MNSLRHPQDTGRAIGEVFVLDRVRIEVALEARSRYKYVSPQLVREGEGWRVCSPNCSRNVDKAGGMIDIAWLVPVLPAHGTPGQPPEAWLLHARDHQAGRWVLKLRTASLEQALAHLVTDEHREFWV